MRISRSIAIAALTIALMVTAVVGLAFATEKTNPASSAVSGFCRGFGGSMMGTISEVLGMSPADIRAERQNGRSLSDIAKEKGVAKDTLLEKMLDAKKGQLDERVKAGYLTQEQADQILKNFKEGINKGIDNTNQGCVTGQSGCAGGAGYGACGAKGQRGGCGGAEYGGCGGAGTGAVANDTI